MADTRRLPTPVVESWDWQLRGSCRDMDSGVFFHPEGERGPARDARIVHAKQVCAGCPVLHQCREHALSVQEPYGVWGGLSESERQAAFRQRSGVVHALDAGRRPVAVEVSGNLRLV